MRVKRISAIILLVVTLVSLGFFYSQRPFKVRLAAYVTDLQARSPEQRRNIERAGMALQDLIVPSGEIFSLNEKSGPYTVERGYVAERSFRGQAVVWTPGGGVCQLASTLYNAAKLADLSILERVPHSQEVSSVPNGQDATVAFGVADLKFQNIYSFPIKIKTQFLQDQLRVEIWGKEPVHEL